jgi:hypothetical protein
MSNNITRRSFVRSSVAIPFVDVLRWCESPQQSHFLMPFEAWGIFASLSITTRRPFIMDGCVSSASASVLANVVIKAWDDIPWYLNFFNGVRGPCDGFDIARSWLTGNGWERRQRAFLGFVRQGAFRVERQGNLAVLHRGNTKPTLGQIIHVEKRLMSLRQRQQGTNP